MQRPTVRTFVAVGALIVIAGASRGGVADAQPVPHHTLQITNTRSSVKAPTSHLVARTTTLPNRTRIATAFQAGQSLASATIPTWTSSVKAYDGNTYHYTIVGKNPSVRHKSQTTKIKTVIIPVSVTFPETGDVFDASTKSCGETASPVQRLQKSPLYAKHSYKVGGKKIGSVQFVDMLQRTEFYRYTKPKAKNPKYHLTLTQTATSKVSLSATGFPDTGSGCSSQGYIDINRWDEAVQSILSHPANFGLPAGIGPTVLPIFVVHNVVFYVDDTANCCILGYHSVFDNAQFGGAPETYSTVDYDTSGQFDTAAQDVSIAAHELSEWANDPFVNNETPSWGHVGQVSGCQGDLEVGDPLSGTTQKVRVNHFTYHPQEEAFIGWFYGRNWGPGKWYSTNGSFRTRAASCH